MKRTIVCAIHLWLMLFLANLIYAQPDTAGTNRTPASSEQPPKIEFLLENGDLLIEDSINFSDSLFGIKVNIYNIKSKKDIIEFSIGGDEITVFDFIPNGDHIQIVAQILLKRGENKILFKAGTMNSNSTEKILTINYQKEDVDEDNEEERTVIRDRITNKIVKNWEELSPFKDKIYEDPIDRGVLEKRIVVGENAIEGGKSIELSWERIRRVRFCGWYIDLGHYNARHAKNLVFRIKLINGDERFWVNIKDNHKNQVGFHSHLDLGITGKEIKTVRIPMSSFGTEIHRSDLKDINFSFDRQISENEGAIIIDDFHFEY